MQSLVGGVYPCIQSDGMGETSDLKGAPLLHVSLVVSDLERSAGFLGELLGFRASFGPVDPGDAFARLTGVEGPARLVQLTREGHPETVELIACDGLEPRSSPMAHLSVAVPDLEAALASARAAGARAMGKTVAFAEGRAAYVREPGGAVLELEELFA